MTKHVWPSLFSLMFSLLSVYTFGRGESRDSVGVGLRLQQEIVSTRSVTAAQLHPIVNLRNSTDHPIFIYLTLEPQIEIDSASRRIVLSCAVEPIPRGMTYYEFPYPLFVRIGPRSSIDMYLQVQCYKQLKRIVDGDWHCTVRIGYLSEETDFLGYLDHGLRERLEARQHLTSSPEIKLKKVSN